MNLERAIQLAYDLRPSASERSIRSALPVLEELAGIEGRHWKPRIARLMAQAEPMASGGLFYQDCLSPPTLADITAVTLTTSQQVLWPVADNTQMNPGDWILKPGQGVQLRCLGRITTPAGAGAITFQFGVGTASGTTGALATSAGLAVTASQSNITFRFEGRIRYRAGSLASATLFAGGAIEGAVFTSTADKLLPASAPAQVTGINLNTQTGVHLQASEAATTGGAIQIHDLELVRTN
jgi:hypothetical protein